MPKIATQDFLEFEQIRDNVIVLKNKGLRAIIMASSLNFALKSSDEQGATIYQFQNFLNSLDFPCQILIHSRQVNITGYLDKLKEIEGKEDNELLQVQIQEYRKFVAGLVENNAIIQKMFYVIIPFSPGEDRQGIITKRKKKVIPQLTEESFQRYREQLLQRVEFVMMGLLGFGIKSVLLDSQEIIEFLWSFYHPAEAEKGYYPEISPEVIK